MPERRRIITGILSPSSAVLKENSESYEIIFIDDGSKDDTLKILKAYAVADNHIRYYSFSRNFGKEAALFAGLQKAKGDYVAVMDADLQDPSGTAGRNDPYTQTRERRAI